MNTSGVRVTPQWLQLREHADAAARATDLLDILPPASRGRTAMIHDLGCGSGAMGRWLAPRLSGDQTWFLYDRDPTLLAVAADSPPTADGAPVRIETRRRDITRLDPADLAGATLITASALLDMLTRDELDRLVTACALAGCPVLFSLSVIGRVHLSPTNPLDEPIRSAFNAHQRRTVGGRHLLGPDALKIAVQMFVHLGHAVQVRPSLWRLDTADRTDSSLAAQWLVGWVGAACEQRPELAGSAGTYLRRRLDAAAAGRLRVVVHHEDLLATPDRPPAEPSSSAHRVLPTGR